MITIGEEIAGINLRELIKVRTYHFQMKLLVYVLAVALLVGLTLYLPGLLWVIPSLLLGLAYAHAVELQHQCLHNTAYRTKRWNRIVGVPLGMPLLVSFSDYQNSHLKHHRLLGTPEDKEFFNYSYQKLHSLTALIPHLLMVRHYRDVAGYIAKSVVGKLVREKEATPKVARKIRSEYQMMAVALVAAAGLSGYFATTIFLKVWALPFVVGVLTHALIELPEHIGCNTTIADVLNNTRTMKASKAMVWFVNGNNYHVEHHWLPAVPNDKFPELHQKVTSRITYLDLSYGSFYKQFFVHLRNKNLHRAWERTAPAQEKRAAAHASAHAPGELEAAAVSAASLEGDRRG
ncbi:MAG TPA: fatty acid desaturase [Pyrinomonadaceae bacterium]|jgi:fatty acid desaturase|nr:fatty acid desaturase [Pyrinomonadaceae bacterium]